jgi:hypothetical protein
VEGGPLFIVGKEDVCNMGCRSSAPLDVVERRRDDEFFAARMPAGDGRAAADGAPSIEVLTLADLVTLDTGRHRTLSRGRRNRDARIHEDHMAEIAAIQQSLSMMEQFFENLIAGQTSFLNEAMDPNNSQGAGPPPASDAAIASLIQSSLTEKELKLLTNKLCSVCCEGLVVGQVVSRLPCGHLYHPNCVEPWLHRHCTCPACRYELPTDDQDFEEGRMQRMKTRKLPVAVPACCEDDSDDDDSSHSSEIRPDITWDETSTTSWGEEGVHLMDGYQHWFDEFREQADEDMFVGNGVRSRNQASWMVRLIDEDGEDRPTSTLPAAMERLNSSGNVREESPDEGGLVTPKISNESDKGRFDDDGDACTDELIAANEQDEYTKAADQAETFSPA